jgi:hypothetical protein
MYYIYACIHIHVLPGSTCIRKSMLTVTFLHGKGKYAVLTSLRLCHMQKRPTINVQRDLQWVSKATYIV